MKKKAFVSGCFDLVHAGHIEFLKRAAKYGELHVSIGSDKTIRELKGKTPVFSERERQYILQAMEVVHEVVVGSGSGRMDFVPELRRIQPDVFVVNEDGDDIAKRELCRELGIEYVVLDRSPAKGLPPQSSTEVANQLALPYRLDLAGGWLDQPWISQHSPGPVLTISLEPVHAFSHRAGMATSTRRRAMRLWGRGMLPGDPEEQARILFSFENPPGTKEISGSQDALGIVLPGLNRLWYNGDYWPERIDRVLDDSTLDWLEDHLRLVYLFERPADYDVLKETHIGSNQVAMLSRYADCVWESILKKDLARLGHYMTACFRMQVSMFPAMVNPEIEETINKYLDRVQGVKISGAGGGGYLVFTTNQELEGSLRLKIRRKASDGEM